MSNEKTYKYVILRDRDGNYLLPYSGAKGLADVAFTGKYSDLIGAPKDDSFLPAVRDVATGGFNVSPLVMFNNLVALDNTGDMFVDDDLAKDTYAVNQDYVYQVVDYIVDELKDKVDVAYDELKKEADPEEKWPVKYRGSTATLADLNRITGELYDVYYVIEKSDWYMCVLNDAGVRVWVNEYHGKKVLP